MRIFTTLLLLLPFLGFSQATNLLISEYGEGNGGNRKYIEIYNGTGATVDLANFQIWKTTNNSAWNTTVLSLTGNLSNGDVYVIANNSGDVPNADLYNVNMINWNGNDAVGLAWNGGTGTVFSVIDVVGEVNAATASDFSVAGIAAATKDKVITRKSSVCSPTSSWTLSSGTNTTDSQWNISALEYNATNQATVTAGLGSHTANCASACATVPAPTASNVAVCSGSTANLSATSTQTGSILKWYNVATNGTALATGATYTTGALTTATSFWVQDSISGCPASARTEVVVSINALPNVNAGADQTVCTGANVTLTGAGAVSYTWNNSVTNATPFAANTTATYTVTGTDANGCINTDNVTVTVSGTAPTANAGTDREICLGETVALTATGTGTFTWDNGVSQAVPFSPTTTTTYTVTVDNGVCTNTDQVVVTVHQPSVAGTISASDLNACAGDVITATIAGNTGTVEWFLQIPPVPFTSVSTSNTFSQTASMAGTYSVKAEVKNGTCAVATSNILAVVVNSLPAVSAGAAQAVCPGTAVTLNGSGASTYTWNNNVTNGTPFTPAATATYTVTGTDANECVNTAAVTVTVNTLPAVNAGADIAVCAGSPVTLTGTGAVSYTWNNSVTNGVAFTPATTTTYTVTGTDANNCTNTDQVTVTVNALPDVTVTVANGAVLSVPNVTGNAYQWFECVNNQPVGGLNVGTAATYAPGAVGSYKVRVTSAAGCPSTSECVTADKVGLEDLKADAGVNLYPNPTKGKVTLNMSSAERANVTVYNALGKVIATMNNLQSGAVIDLSSNQSGVYMIQVSTEKGSNIYRVVRN